jgi:cellulose 1,4-beta-cellobiosidase
VDLSWSASAWATGYEVLRATTPGGPSYTFAGTSSGTKFTDSELPSGSRYYYVVRSKRGSLMSGYSAEASAAAR